MSHNTPKLGAVLLCVLSGCQVQSGDLVEQKGKPDPGKPSLILKNTSYEYSFGRIIGTKLSNYSHTYVLTNDSSKPIKLREFVNAKPCCGEVIPIEAQILNPSESIRLQVKLKTGNTIGQLQHRSLLLTEERSEPIEFWTTANVEARIRIEETTEKIANPFPGQTVKRSFVIYSNGIKEEPPISLVDSSIRISAPYAWEGNEVQKNTDGIMEVSRPISIELHGNDKPGQRTTEISILENGKAIFGTPVNWEVLTSIKVIPAALLVKSNEPQIIELLMQSQDAIKFRIKEITCDTVKVEYAIRNETDALLAKARIQFVLKETSSKQSRITIKTNHPKQPVIELPILQLGK